MEKFLQSNKIFYLYGLYDRIELQSYVGEMIIVLGAAIVTMTALPYHHGLLSLEKPKAVVSIALVNFILSLIVINISLVVTNSITVLVCALLLISIVMYIFKRRLFLKHFV